MVEVAEVRLKKAKERGIENTINRNEDEANDVIRKDMPNGVDITFECAGVQATFNTALKVTKRTGVLQVVALFGKDVSMNMTDDVIMQGINITTTLCYNNSFPAVLGIINNHPETFRKIITKEIGLDQAVDEGIKALAEDKSQVKILVSPDL